MGDGPASQLYYAGNGIAINWQATVSVGVNIEARIATLRLTGSPQSQIGILFNDIYSPHLDGVTIDTALRQGGFLMCALGAVGWSVNCADCSIMRSRFQVSGDGLRLMGSVYNLMATTSALGQNTWGVKAGEDYVPWQPDMCWPQGLTIQVQLSSTEYYFQVASEGRSGLQPPTWPNAPQLGQTISEQLAPSQASCSVSLRTVRTRPDLGVRKGVRFLPGSSSA